MSAEIGMNLSGVAYYGDQHPFIDRMKTAGGWSVQDASWRGMNVPLELDENGYLAKMPAGGAYAYVMVGLDPAALEMTDRYVLTWEGKANFTMQHARVISREEGRIVFEYSGQGGGTQLSLSGLDPSDPLHDMHLVREDQAALFQQGEIFNPDFVEKVSNWSTIRFMDWGGTNGSTLTSWDQRVTPDDMSWATNGGSTSVPIEVMVALANKAGTDMWINIPAMADDDYVRNTLAYVRDNLADGLKVKVEYSNELWNWEFAQASYAHQQGALLWGRDANNDGRIDPTDKAEQNGQGFVRYQGYRAAQVASVAKEVFGAGAEDRLVNVLTTQTSYKGLESYIFWGVDQAGKGGVGDLFDEYAVTTYFGLPGNASLISSWTTSGEAGKAAAFASLRQNLDSLKDIYAYQAAVADRYGLDLVAYEGGTHVTATGAPQAEQARWVNWLRELDADPRMRDLYAKMVDDFEAAGGKELTAFNDVGKASKFGNWGTLEHIYSDSSPKYDALVAASNEAKQAGAGNPGTPPRGPNAPRPDETGASNYTMAEDQRIITFTGKGVFNAVGNALDNTMVGGNGGATLSGNGGRDTLVGGAGKDRLDGGTGADSMTGGKGDDTYYVDNSQDVVIELADGGYDTAIVSFSYVLPDHVEGLQLSGSSAFYGAGNAASNHMVGADGMTLLSGRDGNDTLYGGGGDDMLSGDNGADSLFGEFGNDQLMGGVGNDSLYGGAGNDTLTGGTGVDLLDGGAGADRFVFAPGDLGSTRTTADMIWDFSRSDGDRIDLSAIDANTRVAGNQAFTLIGNKGFSQTAGELRVETYQAYWHIVGDMNGDGAGDLSLLVRQNGISLVASDFIL